MMARTGVWYRPALMAAYFRTFIRTFNVLRRTCFCTVVCFCCHLIAPVPSSYACKCKCADVCDVYIRVFCQCRSVSLSIEKDLHDSYHCLVYINATLPAWKIVSEATPILMRKIRSRFISVLQTLRAVGTSNWLMPFKWAFSKQRNAYFSALNKLSWRWCHLASVV